MANQGKAHRPLVSVVTPCFNEEDNVETCAAEVRRVFEAELPEYDYEHIFSDNASTDATVEILRGLAAADPRIKVLVNSRNVGPFRNIARGLQCTRGDFVVPMVPADLQDPPAVIPELFAKMTAQVDVVYGVRAKRREAWLMRSMRALYYRIVAGGDRNPPAHAGEFLLARRPVIDAVLAVTESYPYIRGLVARTAPRSEVVSYQWGVRERGVSKNSLSDLVDQALNGIVSSVRTPMRWALLAGMSFAAVGVLLGVGNLAYFIVSGSDAGRGIATLIVATFVFGGLNLFFIGLIGEYVIGIHQHLRPDPPVADRERINL